MPCEVDVSFPFCLSVRRGGGEVWAVCGVEGEAVVSFGAPDAEGADERSTALGGVRPALLKVSLQASLSLSRLSEKSMGKSE